MDLKRGNLKKNQVCLSFSFIYAWLAFEDTSTWCVLTYEEEEEKDVEDVEDGCEWKGVWCVLKYSGDADGISGHSLPLSSLQTFCK